MNKTLSRFAGLVLALVAGLTLCLNGHLVPGVLLFGLTANLVARYTPSLGSVLGVNSLGTLATATIVQEALALVFTKRPVLNSISLGFTDRDGSPIAQYGQPVITRTKSVPTVGNATDADPVDGQTTADVSVTLNNFKKLGYQFTATEYSSTNRDLIRECAEPMAVAMANYMVDAVAGLWTIGNFPDRTGADAVANGATKCVTNLGAGWDYAHLVDVRGTLNKAGVPDVTRFYVGNTDVYSSMLSDLRIVGYLNNPANEQAIKTGQLPQVAGMGLAEYPNLTSTTGNAGVLAVAGSADSTVYAARVPRDPRDVIPGLPVPGNIGIVTEPRTGLSVMVCEYVDMSTLAVNMKMLWMYGVAKGNVNNLQLVKG